MFKPYQALKNFVTIIRSLWLLFLSWASVIFLLGIFVFIREGCGEFSNSMYLVYSTALSLGSPSMDSFQGMWRVVELLLDLFGIILWGIFTSVTMKSIEAAYDE